MRNREYCQACACEPEGVCRHCFEQLEKENAELRDAARDMLQLLIDNAPVEGLYESMVEDWGIMLEQGRGGDDE